MFFPEKCAADVAKQKYNILGSELVWIINFLVLRLYSSSPHQIFRKVEVIILCNLFSSLQIMVSKILVNFFQVFVFRSC